MDLIEIEKQRLIKENKELKQKIDDLEYSRNFLLEEIGRLNGLISKSDEKNEEEEKDENEVEENNENKINNYIFICNSKFIYK